MFQILKGRVFGKSISKECCVHFDILFITISGQGDVVDPQAKLQIITRNNEAVAPEEWKESIVGYAKDERRQTLSMNRMQQIKGWFAQTKAITISLSRVLCGNHLNRGPEWRAEKSPPRNTSDKEEEN